MKETGDMDALIQYIMDYIRSHPDFGRPEEAL